MTIRRTLLFALLLLPAATLPAQTAPVTITDNGPTWTLDNGIVKATITKGTGAMPSLIYTENGRSIEVLAASGGTWEHNPLGAPVLTNTVTIDPAANHGQRAEVAIKGLSNGTYMMTRTAPGGGVMLDIEIRYSLAQGDSGIYVYSTLSHPAAYPAMGAGAEDRYITRLNQQFDWITVDKDRNMLEAAPTDWGTGVVVHAKEQRIMSKGVYKNSVEHKYSYSGMQFQTPAYGWSSTANHIGAWFINPTTEYLSGGPTRIDLDAHFGDNANPEPIILDYWHSGHYNGTRATIAAGEEWSKVIGPIFVYVNSLPSPRPTPASELETLAATAGNPTVPPSWTANANSLWQDALAQARTQNSKWPFDWVHGVDYTPLAQRATVTGQLILSDPLAPKGASTKLPHLTVGLTSPDTDPSKIPPTTFRGVTYQPPADAGSWIHDARFYQFFVDGSDDGRFTIPKVRPGHYTLHATADGVLGDFAQTGITVTPGQKLDLGKLIWKPVRYGRQLWEIGYPNRSADKFFKGDASNSWLWGWNLRYALLFPNDVTYTVGKSDPRKDWFFEEVPHATSLAFVNPEARDPANQRFGWVKAESLDQYPQTNERGPWAVYGTGKETVWTVHFNMPSASKGTAALRVAFAGVNGLRSGLPVTLNGQSIGALGSGDDPAINPHLLNTDAIRYNTDKGLWQQRTLKFDATLLHPGDNTLTFTVPAGDLSTGVVWDYLRLELDNNSPFAAAPPAATPTPSPQ